jgi:hypothetical protein
MCGFLQRIFVEMLRSICKPYLLSVNWLIIKEIIMGMSISSVSSSQAQALSSASDLQQQQFAKALETPPPAQAAPAPAAPVSPPYGSVGNNINVTA